jgi:hypothetical protein
MTQQKPTQPSPEIGARVRFVGVDHIRPFLCDLRGWVGTVRAQDHIGLVVSTAARTIHMPAAAFVVANPDEPFGMPGAPEEPWAREWARTTVQWRLESYMMACIRARAKGGGLVEALRAHRTYVEQLDREHAS